MRPIHLAVPAGLALACAGVALTIAANRPHVSTVDIADAPVRHFITEAMMQDAEAHTQKVAPNFKATDSEGKAVELAPADAKRPQLVYFVLDGCPCSFDAEPLFHKLAKRFQGQVDFISVTDAKPAKAKEWSVQMLVNYPVVPDPEKKIIRAYGAKASVYSALVSTRGRIVKMWPGYSADILKEMNACLAKAAGVAEKPFDPEYAPKERAAGCAF